MGRRSNSKSWLTGSKKQEEWATEYLHKKKIPWDSGLANAASRKPISAIAFLKGLDDSRSDYKLLLQRASSAWRAQKSRRDNKQINISISEEVYNTAASLAQSKGYSIKAMIDLLVRESMNKLEELERLDEIESHYKKACNEIERLAGIIEEQDSKLSELTNILNALKSDNSQSSLMHSADTTRPPAKLREVRKKRTYSKFNGG